MPQALKPLSLIHIGSYESSPLNAIRKATYIYYRWFAAQNTVCFVSAPAAASAGRAIIDKWFIMGGMEKCGKFLKQNQFNRHQMVKFECPIVRNPF